MSAAGANSPAAGPLACPRCGGPSVAWLEATDRNRGVTDERFSYRRCTACGVLWLADPPDELARFYPPDYHEFLRGDALVAAAATEAPRVRLISRYVAPGRLVEIGPSQGVFAFAARQAGFDVVGLEMDPACCAHLESEVGVQAINTAMPADALRALPPSRAVVLWHVIEHLTDAWTLLRAIAANLEPAGVLALATPNPQALQFRLFRSRWVHLDAPRHVTLIPLHALQGEAKQLGLRRLGATTIDPVGQGLNRMGWQYSTMRSPRLGRESSFPPALWGRLATSLFGPWERRGLNGAAYTAVFQREAAVDGRPAGTRAS